ncbi:MAG: BBP7 family outer membrane beta-barrel protein [Chlorobium sp.]|nr:BBP7 family outer membrane beta-barrel protein [Chlorobium sp.]
MSTPTSAENLEGATGKLVYGEPPLPSSSPESISPSQDTNNNTGFLLTNDHSRWTVSAEAIILDRIGGADRTLVERVPGTVSFSKVPDTPGVQALNSNDFHHGFSTGPKIGVIYHGDSGFDLQSSYFQVDSGSSTQAIGPDNPANWLVMRAPGGFYQTQDFTYQAMQWDYSTKLYNAEFNAHRKLSDHVAMLAGFRWLQLKENLQGTLPPSDRTEPLWKLNSDSTLVDVARFETHQGIPVTSGFPPFWNTSTTNNLYGLQIGAEGKIFERGRFSIGGLMVGGGYLNHAEESTGVSIFKVVRPSSASSNTLAFLGEAGLHCDYQVTNGLSLKVGYQAIWIDGVALAPGQIQETYTTLPDTVSSLGVNTSSSVLYHGGTVGLKYVF